LIKSRGNRNVQAAFHGKRVCDFQIFRITGKDITSRAWASVNVAPDDSRSNTIRATGPLYSGNGIFNVLGGILIIYHNNGGKFAAIIAGAKGIGACCQIRNLKVFILNKGKYLSGFLQNQAVNIGSGGNANGPVFYLTAFSGY